MPASKSRSPFSSVPVFSLSLGSRPPRRRASPSALASSSAIGALLLLGLNGSACCRLGADEAASDAGAGQDAASLGNSSSSASSASLPPSAQPSAGASSDPLVGAPTAPIQGEREIAGALQILIAYKGAEIAPKGVARSKEEARKRAEDVLAKLKTNKATFAELATQYSDDPSKIAGGAIGNFERNAMPAAFSDATFDLPVGGVSGVVETPRGFHIIQRTR